MSVWLGILVNEDALPVIADNPVDIAGTAANKTAALVLHFVDILLVACSKQVLEVENIVSRAHAEYSGEAAGLVVIADALLSAGFAAVTAGHNVADSAVAAVDGIARWYSGVAFGGRPAAADTAVAKNTADGSDTEASDIVKTQVSREERKYSNPIYRQIAELHDDKLSIQHFPKKISVRQHINTMSRIESSEISYSPYWLPVT
ncbi:hypothetical protein ACJIZ3_008327 [Penstemon smallii]|uniref:Uncharacterized protein n=1 Tax=Penstemon smallii TaxID=265156 RepID=A0ABD3TAD1_9LAMI